MYGLWDTQRRSREINQVLSIIFTVINCNKFYFLKIVKKLTLILFLSSFVSLIHAQTELKFNAASAVLLIPNVGIELPISKHRSVQLDVLG